MTNEELNEIINEYIDKNIILNRCINNTIEYIDICLNEFKNYYDSIEGGYEYAELEKDYIERFNKVLKIIKLTLKNNYKEGNDNE